MRTYLLYDPLRHWVKIGRSVDVEKRVAGIRAASGADLHLLGVLDDDREQEIHRECQSARLRGEWFEITPLVRSVVRDCFGARLPPSPYGPELDRAAKHREALSFFEGEWGIRLDEPATGWFDDLCSWLGEQGLSYEEDGMVFPDELAAAVTVLGLDWEHRFLAVGGTPGETPLGIVLVGDQDKNTRFEEDMRDVFMTVDAYTPLEVGIASKPPRDGWKA